MRAEACDWLQELAGGGRGSLVVARPSAATPGTDPAAITPRRESVYSRRRTRARPMNVIFATAAFHSPRLTVAATVGGDQAG